MMIFSGGAAQHAKPQRSTTGVNLPSSRMAIVGAGLGLLFLLLLGRAFYLQLVKQTFLQGQGSARYSRTIVLEANRGMITDRNGQPLAQEIYFLELAQQLQQALERLADIQP